MLLADAAQTGHTFGLGDWLVIAGYLALTTVVGALLSGKQATVRDFFLGGRRLPWWAICGSIIATEISAVTFVAVPAISFAPGGNFTYLQWAIGAILARVIIGYVFVPRYFEQEIYSPYDYLGRQLGEGAKKTTTGLFFVGAILGQGVRVYVTAIVLRGVTGLDLVTSIWIVGAFSICWTLLGGMTTVIWTDVVQFCILAVGAVVILIAAGSEIPEGWSAAISTASEAGKFEWFNATTDLSQNYTIWVAILAMPFLNLAAFGTDQVMAQRMFCCRNEKEARRAIIVSSVSMVLALLMLCVGVAIYCYAREFPFNAEQQALLNQQKENVLPLFIVSVLPVGIRGLIVAAVFAAAISSLDSTLAALSQTTLSAFLKPRLAKLRRRKQQGPVAKYLSTDIGFSKLLVVFWGIALCGMATACIVIAERYANLVDLAFALVGYTYGPLLGIFLLAFLPLKRDHSGLAWAVPLSMLAIFGMSQHDLIVGHIGTQPIDISDWIVWSGVILCLVAGLAKSRGELPRVTAIVAGALFVAFLHSTDCGTGSDGGPKYLSYAWSYPIGTVMTLGLGYFLGRPRTAPSPENAPPKRKRTKPAASSRTRSPRRPARRTRAKKNAR